MIASERISFILVAAVISYVLATVDDAKDDGQDREAHNGGGQLWFGPRLGKRSLGLSNEENRQTFFKLLEAANAFKFYYDQFQYIESRQADEPETRVSNKVIFTPKLERSLSPYEDKLYDSVKFTPRLGRRLLDDIMLATPTDQKIYRQDPEQTDRRTKYFSPRLGRTVTFSPRLGRELAYEMYPEKTQSI